MPKTKNLVGGFGARYGASVRKSYMEIEEKQRKKQKCPYCKKEGVKRLAKGIWFCKKCKEKFTSDAYFL